MRCRLIAPFAILILAFVLAPPAYAVERTAADTGPDHRDYYTGLYEDYDLAQTFTAMESGELTRIALPLSKWNSIYSETYPWQDLKFDVRSVTAAGKPGSTVLGQAILPHEAVDGSVEVTFPSSIDLTRGEQYALVASTETPQSLPQGWWFIFGMYEWKMPASPYGGGSEWHDFDWDSATWLGGHSDLGLKVYVDDGRDTTDPTIDLRSPDYGQEVLLGSSLIADFSCADEDGGSGLATCAGDAADGAAVDTSSVGLKLHRAGFRQRGESCLEDQHAPRGLRLRRVLTD